MLTISTLGLAGLAWPAGAAAAADPSAELHASPTAPPLVPVPMPSSDAFHLGPSPTPTPAPDTTKASYHDPMWAAALSGGALGLASGVLLAQGALQPQQAGLAVPAGVALLTAATLTAGIGHFSAGDNLRGLAWTCGGAVAANLGSWTLSSLQPGNPNAANIGQVEALLLYVGLASWDAYGTAVRANVPPPPPPQ